MHLDEGIMRSMSDRHLIASLRNTQDDLTDTSVELELLRRLEAWQEIADGFEVETAGDMEEVLEAYNRYRRYAEFFDSPENGKVISDLDNLFKDEEQEPTS